MVHVSTLREVNLQEQLHDSVSFFWHVFEPLFDVTHFDFAIMVHVKRIKQIIDCLLKLITQFNTIDLLVRHRCELVTHVCCGICWSGMAFALRSMT